MVGGQLWGQPEAISTAPAIVFALQIELCRRVVPTWSVHLAGPTPTNIGRQDVFLPRRALPWALLIRLQPFLVPTALSLCPTVAGDGFEAGLGGLALAGAQDDPAVLRYLILGLPPTARRDIAFVGVVGQGLDLANS